MVSRELPGFNIKSYYRNFAGILEDNEAKETVSIIVPVYNVSKYLGRCVDSLLKQTYSNTEILLIDDGSTDDSGSICDAFAKEHLGVKVVHQSNQGLSAARNTGLDIATGFDILLR